MSHSPLKERSAANQLARTLIGSRDCNRGSPVCVRLELPNEDLTLPGGLRCQVSFEPSHSPPQAAQTNAVD